jgi:hypothetical protein
MRIFSCIKRSRPGTASLVFAAGLLGIAATAAHAQDLSASTCNSATGNPPACNQANVRGDRSEGWLAQGRAPR